MGKAKAPPPAAQPSKSSSSGSSMMGFAACFAFGVVASELARAMLATAGSNGSPVASVVSVGNANVANGINCSSTVSHRSDGHIVRTIENSCFPNPFLAIHTIRGLSPAACDEIWRAALKRNKWDQKSTLGDLTADIDVRELSLSRETGRELEEFVTRRLAKFIAENFIQKLDIDGLAADGKKKRRKIEYENTVALKGSPFVIKYEAKGHSGALAALRKHKDNADVSFIMLLNRPDSFDGGGTSFDALGPEPVFMEQGQVMVFNGQLVHSALPITRGQRFVLSGFTYFTEDFLKTTKRLSTLATTVYHH